MSGPSEEFIRESIRWRGRVLTGKYAHWCADWDELPVDETTPEWPCCCCFPTEAYTATEDGSHRTGEPREGASIAPNHNNTSNPPTKGDGKPS